jgi:hypothetical protein
MIDLLNCKQATLTIAQTQFFNSTDNEIFSLLAPIPTGSFSLCPAHSEASKIITAVPKHHQQSPDTTITRVSLQYQRFCGATNTRNLT